MKLDRTNRAQVRRALNSAPPLPASANNGAPAGSPSPDVLTIGQAASVLGVSKSTLRNWDRQGKLAAVRHPVNNYRLYPREAVWELREEIAPYAAGDDERSDGRAEQRFDVPFVAPMALAEKQIQQSYRPYIQVHKWFARRPGTLFRGLLLAEFGGDGPLRETFMQPHNLGGRVVLDPFMGGGTPVLEANRLGMNAIGCDINPMATWIVRQELAAVDVRALNEKAEELLTDLDAKLGDLYATECLECRGTAVVKYFIWVKAVPCGECDADVELFPGYLIASNARHPNFVMFCPECRDLFEVPKLPKRGARVTCTTCRCEWDNVPVAHRNRHSCRACGHEGRYPKDVAQLGAPRHKMIAIEYHCAACKPGHRGRFFKSPDRADRKRFERAGKLLRSDSDLRRSIPDEAIPAGDETTRLHRWGYRGFADLFNDRQLLFLARLARAIGDVREKRLRHALSTVFSDFLRYQNMLGRYDTYALKCQDIFSVHGFPVGLVQCENNVIGIARVGTGGFRHFVAKYIAAKKYTDAPFEVRRGGKRKVRVPVPGERIAGTFVSRLPAEGATREAWLHRGSASTLDLPPQSIDAVITDPPYFDNVQYAELMDFCYVWLRRLVNGDVSTFNGRTTRDPDELTGNRTAGRDLHDFCAGLSSIYVASARALKPGGLFAFTYHHNDLDAYLPVAVALLDAGVIATASIPCPAEMSASLHIARTGSSVIDTILCSRKPAPGLLRRRVRVRGLADALRAQAGELAAGGVQVTIGDLRCMALGQLTVHAINELGPSWDSSVPVADRLSRARGCFEAALSRLGGLEALVEAVAASPRAGQLELFVRE